MAGELSELYAVGAGLAGNKLLETPCSPDVSRAAHYVRWSSPVPRKLGIVAFYGSQDPTTPGAQPEWVYFGIDDPDGLESLVVHADGRDAGKAGSQVELFLSVFRPYLIGLDAGPEAIKRTDGA
jgi:hypothetical protein